MKGKIELNNHHRPLVSIVTVVRNGGPLLEKTIRSVLAQDYDNIEYIVIDGASTDNTVEIIKKYEQEIDYWVSEPDRNADEAINKGVRKSRGELVGIITCGDWYEPDTVSSVVRTFLADRSIDLIYGNMNRWRGDKLLYLACPPADLDKLRRSMVLNFLDCFITKRSYETYGQYVQQYRVATDYELLLRFYCQGLKFKYLNKVLANMIAGGNSDIHRVRGIYECYLISRRHGYPFYKAFPFLVGRLIKWLWRVLFNKF